MSHILIRTFMLIGLVGGLATWGAFPGLIRVNDGAASRGASVPVDRPSQEHAAPTALPQSVPPLERPVYILDPNDQAQLSRIVIIDPDLKRVAFEIPTRFLPEIALSSDGKRVFVADTYLSRVTSGTQHDVLSIFDARTGTLLADDISAQGRTMYKGLPFGDPFMFLSADGSRLFVQTYGDPDPTVLGLRIYDTASLKLLHTGAWPHCDQRIVIEADAWLCMNRPTMTAQHSPDAITFTLDRVDPQRAVVEETLMTVTAEQHSGIVGHPNGRHISILTPDALLTVIDIPERRIVASYHLDKPAAWQASRLHMEVSPDGQRLYIGGGPSAQANQGQIEDVRIYDTTGGQYLGTLHLRYPAFDIALSAAGEHLYTVEPTSQSVGIYDTHTLQEITTLTDLGGNPARIVTGR